MRRHLSAVKSRLSIGLCLAAVIPLGNALPHMQEVAVSRGTGEMIQKGLPAARWAAEVLSALPDSFEGPVKVVEGGKLRAILKRPAHPEAERGSLEVMRVFV